MTSERLRRALRDRAKRMRALLWRIARRDRIARYLQSTATPALILGAGSQARDGWLASDLKPKSSAIVAIDARRRLPFADGSLAYVFAEHMIEHIDYSDGRNLIREIYRVLRPGGVVRIATPDLVRCASLVVGPLDAAAQAYVDWSNRTLGGHVNNRPSFVLNRLMRWWGHAFLYDRSTLTDLLAETGFVALEMQQIGQSRYPMLQGMEHHGDVISEQANRFETMVIEGAKPSLAR